MTLKGTYRSRSHLRPAFSTDSFLSRDSPQLFSRLFSRSYQAAVQRAPCHFIVLFTSKSNMSLPPGEPPVPPPPNGDNGFGVIPSQPGNFPPPPQPPLHGFGVIPSPPVNFPPPPRPPNGELGHFDLPTPSASETIYNPVLSPQPHYTYVGLVDVVPARKEKLRRATAVGRPRQSSEPLPRSSL